MKPHKTRWLQATKKIKKILVEFIAAQQAFSFHGKLISGDLEVTPKTRLQKVFFFFSYFTSESREEAMPARPLLMLIIDQQLQY